MALVRCAIHRIPYNDDRPGGCPACERERVGDDQGSAIRALAKAAKALHGKKVPDTATGDGTETERATLDENQTARESLLTPLTSRPRTFGLVLGLAILAGAVSVWLGRGPQFVDTRSPAPPPDEIRPLGFEPNTPIDLAFATLGVRQPKPHPDSRQLARYEYGSDLTVDVLNGVIYEVALGLSGRSWRGLQVGLLQQNAEGRLALLGDIHTPEPDPEQATLVSSGYAVYLSMAERPRRVRKVEVRPPNGCFDVVVDIQPQVIGWLVDGSERLPVVARGGEPPSWVVTRVHVISRALPGAGLGEIVC